MKRGIPFLIGTLLIVWILAGCTVTETGIAVSRIPKAIGTAVPTKITTPTETAVDTATAEPTETATSQPTFMATPFTIEADSPFLGIHTDTSIIFTQGNTLQRWYPHSDEVELLVEGMRYSDGVVAGLAIIRRELGTGEDTYSLYHIPSGTETEIMKTPTYGTSDGLRVSPNGRWLVYGRGDIYGDDYAFVVHEISENENGISISESLITIQPAAWDLAFHYLDWPTENEFSWVDGEGLWIVDLESLDNQPRLAITQSTNTYEDIMTDVGVRKGTWHSYYTPWDWSPDGRFLLVVEHANIGLFVVIDRDTNRTFLIPDSSLGQLSDSATWIDNETLLHHNLGEALRIWKINPDNDPPLILEKEIPFDSFEISNFHLANGDLRFQTGSVTAGLGKTLFALDVASGQWTLSQSGPYEIGQLIWSPDSQYALVDNRSLLNSFAEPNTKVLLMRVRDQQIEMLDALGSDSCCWQWYQEQPD